jgi:cbb3-type cytochrome oxidase maturation protein
MSVIILLLIASVSVASLFLAAFLWTVKSGQYDDQVSPPLRMLFDNPPSAKENTTPSANSVNQNSKP